ncbi:MAG: hypothetical protein GTO13_00790, partial [Proteobacteria bacterium]|nr:hypothetical protein [Pseudomonadota bacterium]
YRADSLMIGGLRVAHLISVLIVAVVIPLLIKERLWSQERTES